MTRGRQHRKTQRQRILDALVAARGRPVNSWELARIALQYNARVKELRATGFVIHSNETTGPDGIRHTTFTLELGMPGVRKPPAKATVATVIPSSNQSPTLFGDLSPLRYPD